MEFQHILYSAVNSQFGIEVTCLDPAAFRSQLYAEIRQAKEENNHDFDNLSIHISPVAPQSNLWIRKNVEKDTPPESQNAL